MQNKSTITKSHITPPFEKCLYCYSPLKDAEKDFHFTCSKKFFETELPPEVDFSLNEIEKLAVKVLGRSIALTGVQPKLSVEIAKSNKGPKRLTIVGFWGNYILKPPFSRFPEMPEVEDLTMHLAQEFGIKSAGHSLIRLKSGELAYISKRFDRVKSGKLHVEDMAQITETLTERKYFGSMEKVGRAILKYSSFAGNDAIRFFELTLFCFLTGNADMHLKNYSLLTDEENYISLSPAYDLLSTSLLLPDDKEELALPLNGKKSNFSRKDFEKFAEALGINEKAFRRIIDEKINTQHRLNDWIDMSFLKSQTKVNYKELIMKRMSRLT